MQITLDEHREQSTQLCGFCRLQLTPGRSNGVASPRGVSQAGKSLRQSNLLTKGLNSPQDKGVIGWCPGFLCPVLYLTTAK